MEFLFNYILLWNNNKNKFKNLKVAVPLKIYYKIFIRCKDVRKDSKKDFYVGKVDGKIGCDKCWLC